ncbi:MAG: phosphoribosylformylglycinamidine cyclo-ligase [Bdellovibrionales bacterium CG10_big_fil_rev_8_21_14_0_10_45_34]|nr:MAG: phosphoribosylformylglycinamidine cyclo-ligase [Bdellovibrionales bacterium CG10_big_fil_rev_8_21_14_0_10_45_34]
MDYKSAGVDIGKADQLVEWISARLKNHPIHKKGTLSGVGGFAAFSELPFSDYKKPILVTCTDGVGTKVKLANHFENFSGIGQDLVAMCANDMAVSGARPCLFLDYFATSSLSLQTAQEILESIFVACENIDTAVVGGETAELPGLYQPGDFDLAGFLVGLIEKERLSLRESVKAGDLLIGVASSGFHSNGYSLLRKIFEKDLAKYEADLMEPTRLYVSLLLDLYDQELIKSASHITGGGILNVPRAFKDGLAARINGWPLTKIYSECQKRASIDNNKMLRTWNCGVGIVLVVAQEVRVAVEEKIARLGWASYLIGEVIEASAQTEDRLDMSGFSWLKEEQR